MLYLFSVLTLVLALALPTYNTTAPGYSAFIDSIYDADTLTIITQPSPLTQSWQREKIRLYDVARRYHKLYELHQDLR